MQAKTIVKFIFSIIASLALLCIIFPNDGIPFFGTKLKFPSIAEVIKTPVDSALIGEAPKDVINKRKSDLDIAKENEFRSFCETNPARFFMPNNDVTYFDNLFKALDGAKSNNVRIMHYGDSQLECDRISCDLRSRFQSQFGGGGVGLIPVIQTIPTYTLGQSTSPKELSRGLVYGPSKNRASHNRYGIMGQVTRVNSTVKINVEGRLKKYPISAKFNRVKIYAKGGSYSVSTENGTTALKNSSPMLYIADLPDTINSATISLRGGAEVYGVVLEGKTGVSFDNIPMRGCSGTIFTLIDSSSMAPFFENENVKLIILQYGGNSVPYLNGDKGIANYKNNIKKQIELFKRLEPSACILFIGPADMATRKNGVMASYSNLPKVIKALREAANESGVAFWDMYSAMGGKNSIVKWVKNGLAGSDHIHFTPKGANEISEILYKTFNLYYKFYRFRAGLEETTQQTKK